MVEAYTLSLMSDSDVQVLMIQVLNMIVQSITKKNTIKLN